MPPTPPPPDPRLLMNETRRKPATGKQSPSLFDKWHRILYMPSHTDRAGHTLITRSWGTGGKAKVFSAVGGTRTDNTSAHSRTFYQLSQPGSPFSFQDDPYLFR